MELTNYASEECAVQHNKNTRIVGRWVNSIIKYHKKCEDFQQNLMHHFNKISKVKGSDLRMGIRTK